MFVFLNEFNYILIGRQGPAGPPGRYDPNLDEISLGPIGPQGEIGPQGDIGVPGIPGEVGRRGLTGDPVSNH